MSLMNIRAKAAGLAAIRMSGSWARTSSLHISPYHSRHFSEALLQYEEGVMLMGSWPKESGASECYVTQLNTSEQLVFVH